MSWRKVLLLVEGQTEEGFVKRVLQPEMPAELQLVPVIVGTKRVNAGGKFKGGVPSYPKAKDEIERLLRDSSAKIVTTMLDYYGLPSTFPGRSAPSGQSAVSRVRYVEGELNRDIGSNRFRAYLSLHEFEALLFSDVTCIAESLTEPSLLVEFETIRKQFQTPEEINDNAVTSPAARITSLYPSYSKPLFGSLIAMRIGLNRLCQECKHFAEWVSFLQSL